MLNGNHAQEQETLHPSLAFLTAHFYSANLPSVVSCPPVVLCSVILFDFSFLKDFFFRLSCRQFMTSAVLNNPKQFFFSSLPTFWPFVHTLFLYMSSSQFNFCHAPTPRRIEILLITCIFLAVQTTV